MPQVSVIIPTHNRADFVGDAIASVLHQTFSDLELIVVDDASVDNTAERVAAFKDPRIKYIRHESNRGGSAARNTGIVNSSGEYVAFLDDDDEWLPEKLAKQVEVLRRSSADVGCVYTGWLDVSRVTGEVTGRYVPTKRGNMERELLAGNCVGSSSSALLRRECLAKLGLFDESLPCSQDYDLWIRVSKQFLFDCVPEPLFKYHMHENKISHNLNALTAGVEIMAQKYRAYPLSYYREQYIDIGILHCLAGDLCNGRRAFWNAIKCSPIQVRAYFNFLLTLFGAKKFNKIKQLRRRFVRPLAALSRK